MIGHAVLTSRYDDTGGDWCCCWFMYKKEEFSNEVGMNIIAGN